MDELVEKLKAKLSDQLLSTGSASSQSKDDPLSEPVILKRTVCYIVSAVVIEEDKVLMMREAKKRCHGLWYLPAGRVEANETLAEATKREVLEETGLIFEPTNLVCIEAPSLDWLRFNFTGRITGGKLKTLETKDKESLEAGWFSPEEVFSGSLPLRATDICPLIKLTKLWNETKKIDPFFSIMPQQKPHRRMTIQVILLTQNENGMKVLIDKEKKGFLEVMPTTGFTSVGETGSLLIKRALKANDDFRIIGVVRVEHNGGPHGAADGTCITLLAELVNPSSLELVKNNYIWLSLDDNGIKSQVDKLCIQGGVDLLRI